MRREHQQAALFTIVLHAGLLALLMFGGFQLAIQPPKGHQGISAELVDLSQWRPSQESQTDKPKTAPKPKSTSRPVPKPIKKQQPAPKTETVTSRPKANTHARDLQRQKDAERQRKLEEIRRLRQAAERQRQLEAERLKQLEVRQEQNRGSSQNNTAGLEDGVERAKKALLARYIQSIKSRVASNWARPPATPKNLRCRVKVRQIPGGGVIDASISAPCNADALVKKSIINAVKRSDPLPYEGFEEVFERSLSFTFTLDEET